MAGPRPLLAALTLAAFTAGCATTHLVEPVGRGQTRVNASLGGPLIRVAGITTPIPVVSVNVAHGLEENIDISAGLHPVAAAFSPGNGSGPLLGMDVGAAWHPIPRFPRALTVGASVYAFGNRTDAVVFSDAWIAGGGRPTSWLMLAGGLHNMIRFGSSEPEVDARSIWAPNLFAMAAFGPFARWQIELEFRWYAFTQNGRRSTVDFIPIGELGAFGILLGVSRTFGQHAPAPQESAQ